MSEIEKSRKLLRVERDTAQADLQELLAEVAKHADLTRDGARAACDHRLYEAAAEIGGSGRG